MEITQQHGKGQAMEWQPIDRAVPDPGAEIVIRLANPKAGFALPKLLGASVHQIAQWDADGHLWCNGYLVPPEVIEGFIPLPTPRYTATS